jgi:tRNA pseudouridine38-40 synthase
VVTTVVSSKTTGLASIGEPESGADTINTPEKPGQGFRIKLVIEYNGSFFSGWQQQPGVVTVQEEITKALEIILREPIHPLIASGRTDAGVHARGQVAHFTCSYLPDLYRMALGVSALLRGKVAICSAEVVAHNFHALSSAKAKQYKYQIINRYSPLALGLGYNWYIARKLDRALMDEAAAALVGTFDYTSFRSSDCQAPSPVKTIMKAGVEWNGDQGVISVIGNGFLHNMVRIIAGTLVDIAQGRLAANSMPAIIAGQNRSLAGQTAPAHGLYLEEVYY